MARERESMTPAASPELSPASRLCWPPPGLLPLQIPTAALHSSCVEGLATEWAGLACGGVELNLGRCMKQQEPRELYEATAFLEAVCGSQ